MNKVGLVIDYANTVAWLAENIETSPSYAPTVNIFNAWAKDGEPFVRLRVHMLMALFDALEK